MYCFKCLLNSALSVMEYSIFCPASVFTLPLLQLSMLVCRVAAQAYVVTCGGLKDASVYLSHVLANLVALLMLENHCSRDDALRLLHPHEYLCTGMHGHTFLPFRSSWDGG